VPDPQADARLAPARVARAWAYKGHWDPMSILDPARLGKFSSERSIRDYAEHIRKVQTVQVPH
jgi:glycogen phosphorylase